MENHRIPLYILGLSSVVFMVVYYLTPLTTNDFWIQLKIGDIIRQGGEIPRTVLFSYTEAKDFPFVAHEWLPSVIFSQIYEIFGYYQLITIKCLLYFVIFGLLILFAKRSHGNMELAVITSVFIMLLANYRSFLRPEVFAYMFFLIQLNLLDKLRHHKSLWLIVGVILTNILWVNSHGSFLVSIGLPFVFVCGNILDQSYQKYVRGDPRVQLSVDYYFIALGFICILTSLMNPFGLELHKHVYSLSQNDYVKSTIFEWRGPFHASVRGTTVFKLYITYLLLLVPFVALNYKKLNGTSWILLVVFGFLSYEAHRHIAFFAFASIVPISMMIGNFNTIKTRYVSILALVVSMVLLGTSYRARSVGNTVGVRSGYYHSARISQQALNFMKEKNLSGNVLNTYAFGGQLIYYRYPEMKITLDSRIDAYGRSYMSKYFQLWNTSYRNFSNYLELYDVKHIIGDRRILKRLARDDKLNKLINDGWKWAYSSPRVLILSKE